MTKQTPSKKPLILSAFLHVVVLIILVVSVEFSAPMPVVSNNDSKVVNAIALKDTPIIAPPTKVIEEKPVMKPEAQQPAPPLPPKPVPETAAAKPAPAPVQIPTRDKKLAIDDHKKELSKELLADLEDELAKQTKAKQKKMKNKFSQELKSQSEKALQQLMKEQKPVASQRSQHMQGVIDKFRAQILQAIGQQWVVPSHVNKKLTCELLIRLAPGGVVVDVQITKSSGDVSLDRSARAAVFKASPLPVPEDIISFEPFREFVLKVKPENIQDDNNGDQGFWLG